MKVHFRRAGARRTVCGIKVLKTKNDTAKPEKVTCKNCLRSTVLRG